MFESSEIGFFQKISKKSVNTEIPPLLTVCRDIRTTNMYNLKQIHPDRLSPVFHGLEGGVGSGNSQKIPLKNQSKYLQTIILPDLHLASFLLPQHHKILNKIHLKIFLKKLTILYHQLLRHQLLNLVRKLKIH